MSHIRQLDHVGITVADLDPVTAFFADLRFEVDNLQAGRRRPGRERIRTGRRDRSAREHLADGSCARAGGNRRLAGRAHRLTPNRCSAVWPHL